MRNDIRRRKNKARRERIIMIASSALVLGTLAITGVHLRNLNKIDENDGYEVDFVTMEDSAPQKLEEIEKTKVSKTKSKMIEEKMNMEDDLDYVPMEVDSHAIEIGKEVEMEEELPKVSETEDLWDEEEEIEEEALSTPTFSYSEVNGLTRPIANDVLLHFSMNQSIYFKTLDQYKYNSAVIFSAAEGDAVYACAAGQVLNIYDDPYTGKTLVLDMGNGYVATYGQLKDLRVDIGDYVEDGAEIGYVAHASIYYSLEGDNLYFAVKHDDECINPENLFR